jgi:hypothetical protein
MEHLEDGLAAADEPPLTEEERRSLGAALRSNRYEEHR